MNLPCKRRGPPYPPLPRKSSISASHDSESIRASVEKPGRASVAHEGCISWGHGAEIAASQPSHSPTWTPPFRRAGALDTGVGYRPRPGNPDPPATTRPATRRNGQPASLLAHGDPPVPPTRHPLRDGSRDRDRAVHAPPAPLKTSPSQRDPVSPRSGATRGLTPIPAFGIGCLQPVCPVAKASPRASLYILYVPGAPSRFLTAARPPPTFPSTFARRVAKRA